MRSRRTALLTALVGVALLSAAVAAPTAAHAEDEADYHVRLEESGDAVVTERQTYDLGNETERERFEELLANESAQAAVADRYENRTTVLAENASEATGREMSIDRVSIVVSEADDVGVVTLTTSWSGLAAVDDDRVVVTEPFASGFHPGVPTTITAPRGYEIVAASPEPSTRTEREATWEGNTTLRDFEFAAEPAAEGGDDGRHSEEDGSGFGAPVALAGLLAGLYLAARSVSGRSGGRRP